MSKDVAINQVPLLQLFRAGCIVLSLLAAGGQSFAQDFPAKPVKILVPWPAGGGTDIMARFLALHLSEMWKQPVIVDNKPGASGNLGMELASRMSGDGYTLVMEPSNHSINPPLFGNLKFDPIKDFTTVVLVASSPVMLAVHPSVPARSLNEFLEFARSKPNTLSYASCGNGTPQHLAGELLKFMAKVDMTHIPYRGCAPAIADLIGGQVQASFSTVGNLSPHIQAGKAVGIAVTGARRTALAPELPTVAEAGLKGYDVDVWFGLLAPGRPPKPVIDKINADVNRILADPARRQELIGKGYDPLGGTPDQFDKLVRSEITRWSKLIRDVGIKVD